MRTNIVIDDALMRATLDLTGAKTKRDAVHAAMREYVRLHRQGEFLKFKGKLPWDGDLDAMRRDR